MDEASADLILSLQLGDLEDLKQELGPVGDADTLNTKAALDFYREELQANAAILKDHRYGQKLGEVETGSQPPSPVASATPIFDDALTKSLAQLTVQESSSSDTHQTDSSASYEDTAGPESCTACYDEGPHWRFIEAPCGDLYCEPCMVELFNLAMKDESLFPPRCCKQPIGLDLAGSSLNAVQRQEFEEKSVEFNTTDRTYCHLATCAAFIPPANIDGEKAACQRCERLTCAICKSGAHDGDCPEDPNYVSLMEAATAAGYQACHQCKRLVELNFGCNHMT